MIKIKQSINNQNTIDAGNPAPMKFSLRDKITSGKFV